MNIVKAPNQILTSVAKPVAFGKNITNTLVEMGRMVIDAKALGLAAPQVGISERFFVMKPGTVVWFIINPEITGYGKETETLTEGCLSIPDVRVKVMRPREITVTFYDEHWKKHSKSVSGMFARVFQHEFDHLEGKLIA